jgi:hypothetical protein
MLTVRAEVFSIVNNFQVKALIPAGKREKCKQVRRQYSDYVRDQGGNVSKPLVVCFAVICRAIKKPQLS